MQSLKLIHGRNQRNSLPIPRQNDFLGKKVQFFEKCGTAEFPTLPSSQLHCDEPGAIAVTPSAITPARFGTVPRHYIRCTEDRAVPLACQDYMIAAVDAAIGGNTTVHSLPSSHSPFLSQPKALAAILAVIAGQ